jgi:hypothetical protein
MVHGNQEKESKLLTWKLWFQIDKTWQWVDK